jgi:hypothetical protein
VKGAIIPFNLLKFFLLFHSVDDYVYVLGQTCLFLG